MMMKLPFMPMSQDQCVDRILRRKNPAKLSRLRLTYFPPGEAPRLFNLYTFDPSMFENVPRHFFSRCGSVVVIPHRVLLPGEDRAVTIKGQYHVFYHGVALESGSYIIRETLREKKARLAARYKRSGGVDETIEDDQRNPSVVGYDAAAILRRKKDDERIEAIARKIILARHG